MRLIQGLCGGGVFSPHRWAGMFIGFRERGRERDIGWLHPVRALTAGWTRSRWLGDGDPPTYGATQPGDGVNSSRKRKGFKKLLSVFVSCSLLPFTGKLFVLRFPFRRGWGEHLQSCGRWCWSVNGGASCVWASPAEPGRALAGAPRRHGPRGL